MAFFLGGGALNIFYIIAYLNFSNLYLVSFLNFTECFKIKYEIVIALY